MYNKDIMTWYGRIGNKFKAFGRTLGRDTKWLGRQLSTGANVVGKGLGQAQNFVSKLEKNNGNIPILGTALHLANGALGTLHGVADIGKLGGTGLQQLGSGNVQGAIDTGKQIGKLGGQTLAQGAGVAAQVAPFL